VSVLGAPVAPSRPVSGVPITVRSRPASASVLHEQHKVLRPRSATALQCVTRAVSAGSARQTARQLQAASSGAVLGPGCSRIVRYQPAQALRTMLVADREVASGLRAEIELRDRRLEDQQAQMRVLQAMVRRQILEESDFEGQDSADEVVYEAQADHLESPVAALEPSVTSISHTAVDTGQSPKTASAFGERGHIARGLTSAGALVRGQYDKPRPASAQWRKAGEPPWSPRGKRRPTSAGGVLVESARSALRRTGHGHEGR
jgi:hypothetical protein